MPGTSPSGAASFASASTFSLPQNTDTGVTFNFSSPFATGATTHQEANPNAPATATATAAEGNAGSSVAGTGVNTPGGGAGAILPAGLAPGAAGLSGVNWTYVLIGAAVVLLAVIAVKLHK